MTFFLFQKGVYLACYDTFSSFVMHSCLSASCVLWYIRMESVWLMFSGWLSSLPTVVSSRSHSTEAAGSLEAGKHCFPSRLSGGLCQRWLNQPFGQTLQQPADLSLPVVSPLSKIRLFQRVVSCCVGVFILQFPPLGLVFSVSHRVRIPSLWGNRSPKEGWFFHTDPIPTELVLL